MWSPNFKTSTRICKSIKIAPLNKVYCLFNKSLKDASATHATQYVGSGHAWYRTKLRLVRCKSGISYCKGAGWMGGHHLEFWKNINIEKGRKYTEH
jgi:hypothetical protein